MSGHDLHGKQAMDRGEGRTYSFYTTRQMVISREGNKEIRTTREGWIGCRKVSEKGLIFVDNVAINHHR